MNGPPDIPRHVRPRKRTQRAADLNLIVVTGDQCFSEHTPGHRRLVDLPALLRDAPPSLVVCTNHGEVFQLLDAALGDDPLWDWQLSVQQKTLPGVNPRLRVEDVSITLCGWKNPAKNKRGRWHHFLDPEHFAPNVAWPTDIDLYAFGADVRAFLADHDLAPTARAGGIAAQLLRHPDIYETPRRQVPRFINDLGRGALPGNHYQFVDGKPGTEYSDVWYMDQESAHHNIARQIALPHADHLVAVGNHWQDDDTERPADRPWKQGSKLDRFLDWGPKGLIYARIRRTPPEPGQLWQPRQGLTAGDNDPAPRWYRRLLGAESIMAYLFTNELGMLPMYGAEIDYVVGAWISTHGDDCMAFYAEWALHQTRQSDGLRRLWLKPTLHAVYGMLAARTVRVEFVRKRGRAAERLVQFQDAEIHGTSGGPRTFTPKIGNVIQRGMIEAETRKRSCLLALSMKRRGYNVLSIYADGVLVEPRDDDGGAPTVVGADRVGSDWRAKDRLRRLRYQDETHFVSATVVKWPGQPTKIRAQIDPGKEAA